MTKNKQLSRHDQIAAKYLEILKLQHSDYPLYKKKLEFLRIQYIELYSVTTL